MCGVPPDREASLDFQGFALAFEQLAKHAEWHLTRGASPGTQAEAHAPLDRDVIGSFANTVPQMSIDAGLAPCPGCKRMLSTVQGGGGSDECEWERHVRGCGACHNTALRLPHHNGAANWATPREFTGWLRQRSTCGSQAALAAEAGPPRPPAGQGRGGDSARGGRSQRRGAARDGAPASSAQSNAEKQLTGSVSVACVLLERPTT